MEHQSIATISHLYLLIVGIIGLNKVMRAIVLSKNLEVIEKTILYLSTLLVIMNYHLSQIIFPLIGSYYIARFQTDLFNEEKKNK